MLRHFATWGLLVFACVDAAEPASRVPAATAQGRVLAPQAVSAVHIGRDGRTVLVGTLAFRHDANLWQFDPDGNVVRKQFLLPWAPLQIATTADGRTLAVGLANSRITSPEPTVWIGPADSLWNGPLNDEFVAADTRDSERARWRTGSGNWRDGWFASQFGELFACSSDGVFQPPATWVDRDGKRTALRAEPGRSLPTQRATRMAVSSDDPHIAFAGANGTSLWAFDANGPAGGKPLWTLPPTAPPNLGEPPFPDVAREFPALAKRFRLAADEVRPTMLPTGLAVRGDNVVAVIEHPAWQWIRSGPAIGSWDPPIHVLNFVPSVGLRSAKKATLHIRYTGGYEVHAALPIGLSELGFGADDDLWCWPAAWPARGMAGAAWLPTAPDARRVLRLPVPRREPIPFEFPDAVAHAAVNPVSGDLLVSCWDGRVYRVSNQRDAGVEIGAPARLAWSPDGKFAIAGTDDGRVVRLNSDGRIAWTKPIPVTEPPAPAVLPAEVVPGLPVFQGGRIPGGEHAYVGDIWVIRDRGSAVMVDCGGVSGVATTRSRLASLGIERVTHILHTHSHGDHCGGAYLWRAAGARIVAPRSAELTLTWLMPMLSDYGIFPPRPVDDPLPLDDVGDEAQFTAGSRTFRVLFVPGHSFDAAVYLTEFDGRRVAFTGDLGFEKQDILHRCWGDAAKARAVVRVIREKLLAWKPDVVFTGHGVRTNGTEFIADLVRRTEESLAGP